MIKTNEICFEGVQNPCLVQWREDTDLQPSPAIVKSWHYLSHEQLEALRLFSELGETERVKVISYCKSLKGARGMKTLEKLLTCEQVAERYSVALKTVWMWIRTKKLSASKVGGRVYRIRQEDLEEFEKQYKTTKEEG